MNLSRPTAALAALIMNSACSDVPESQQTVEAFAPDASSDVPRLSSETKNDVSATCSGFTLTSMSDPTTGVAPINTTAVRGDLGIELGCWHVENPCDKPLVMKSATFTRGGVSSMGQFTERYIPKVADMRVIDKQKNTVTFLDAPMTFPANASWDFCLAGSVPADALCNTPTTYSIANAEDLNMTYDGNPVTAGDFVDTDFPVVGGETTVACGTKFVDVTLSVSSPTPSSAPIGSVAHCLDVDLVSNGNYMTLLKHMQLNVERQGVAPASAKGGLLDTSNPDQTNTNVGPSTITKISSGTSSPLAYNPIFYGNDDAVQFPLAVLDYKAATLLPQTKETLSFGLGIGNVKALIGDKVRCIFVSKPVITRVGLDDTPSTPLDPSLIGPEKDIVGPWITITE